MRKHLPFFALLALVALSRIVILLCSQTHVHSDESIIGLMAKHILEGRYYPFYMYGQPYNACAAWEAYLAAGVFALFGVGVIQLKSCILLVSMLWLVFFYRLASQLYGRTTAWWSSLVLVLLPSLLKWDFQVRGYSFYFLAIPILAAMFFSIAIGSQLPRARTLFLFGLACGISVWCLELILSLAAAFWILLALRRRLSALTSAAGLAGFLIGYLPAVIFNFTHHFSSWRLIFLAKAGAPSSAFHLSAVGRILFVELPKFFGPDTVLWFFPETPFVGWIFYGIAALAVLVALTPFFKAPVKMKILFGNSPVEADADKGLLVFVLLLACSIPYLITPIRVPGYLLGGCFFLSLLIGRLLRRCFVAPSVKWRCAGALLAFVMLAAGISTEIQVARHDQIETLTLDNAALFRGASNPYRMTRIPGADLDEVERVLVRDKIPAVWTTMSFVYPLIFETDEKLAVSGAIFGFQPAVYPASVMHPIPDKDFCEDFVLETNSPYLSLSEARCAKATGAPPLVRNCGTLAVIEAAFPGPVKP
ncbi:MAG: ArnT family glycosyltransferase [Limisphaerales bacterium]